MTNPSTFRLFCTSVSRGESPTETHCTAESPKEVLELLDMATKATRWLAEKGVESRASGKGNIQENGFSFRAGSHTFTVLPPSKSKPVKKGVADTSVEKYYTLDTRGQTMKVAIAAAAFTKSHGFTTDNQVAQQVGIPAARVSARRAEIERISGVVIAGVPHYFETAGRVKCPVTGNSVNGWMVVEAGQAKLFE